MNDSTAAHVQPCRVLVVDDEKWIRHALVVYLSRLGCKVDTARSGPSGIVLASRRTYDVILLDLEMPGSDGLSTLRELRKNAGQALRITLTASVDEQRAGDALKLGADSCLLKPLDGEALTEVADWLRIHQELRLGGPEHRRTGGQRWPVAASARAQALLLEVARAARQPGPVLMEGEAGTGRGFLARLLHLWSPRSAAPLVWIDCARRPQGLLEEELFGNASSISHGGTSGLSHGDPGGPGGADAAANRGTTPALEAAREGSLYLEEIGELPPKLQRRLVEALQELDRPDRPAPRLIASTSRDLRREAARGRFRGDLLGRVAGTRIRAPPLRQRPDDILPLALRFLRITDLRLGRPARGISPEAERLLLRRRWQGNIHELVDVVERAAIAEGAEIRPRDLRGRTSGLGPSSSYLAKARNGFSRVIRRIVASDTPEAARAGRKDSTR